MKKALFLVFIPFLAFQSHATKDLNETLGDLSDSDRKAVIDIKQEIATWPKKLQDEIKAYQDLMIALRAEADEKYNALSPDAQSALKKEEQLVAKLSPDAVKQLESVAKNEMAATNKKK
jgi:predicted  nucleic acid-binding Zn-ribbon protein